MSPTTIFSVSEDDVSPIFLPSNIGFAGAGVTGVVTSNGIILTIPGGGTSDGVGYDEILDEGSGITKRAKLNFIGAGVNCVDNASRSECTISGTAFDATTIDAVIWSDGANASNLWTFDVSGTNVTVTWGNATVTIVGVVVADGFTLGQDENLTLGAETLDHDGTNFVFSDSVFINGSDDEIQLTVQGNDTQTSNIWVVEESDGTDIVSADTSTVRVLKNFSVGGSVLLGDGGDSFSIASDGIDIDTNGEITNTPKITVTSGDSYVIFNNTVTADPCGTGTGVVDTGALYLSSGGFLCYCDDTATSVDLLVSSNGACTY